MKTYWNRSQLTYCTNVHPAKNLQQVNDVVAKSVSGVRQRRELATMSAGLWISHANVATLNSRDYLQHFSKLMKDNGITLSTLNGFPAQDFHSKEVKQAVYRPDWSEPERLTYTLKLARVLTTLLDPNESEGTISTVPLGFAPGWSEKKHDRAMQAIGQCLVELDRLNHESHRRIRLCLEMEPGCVLQTTDRLIGFFNSDLVKYFNKHGIDENLINQYLGICFDVCHQAVMFEDIYMALNHIHQAGVHIGKMQISSALELKDPMDSTARSALAEFIEEKYLHQSCCMDNQGQRQQVIDLDQAFETFPSDKPWRVHFHVPIQAETLISEGLGTTQQDICRALDFLMDNPEIRPHLEVETYTWTALPESIRPTTQLMIIDGLTTELDWLENQMQKRDLLAESRV